MLLDDFHFFKDGKAGIGSEAIRAKAGIFAKIRRRKKMKVGQAILYEQVRAGAKHKEEPPRLCCVLTQVVLG